MAYKIEFGPRHERLSVDGLTTENVMQMYDVYSLNGEHVTILNDAGEVLDPHQLALDLRSGWGR